MQKITPDSPSCCRAFADDGDDGDDKGPAHIHAVDCHGKCATRLREGATYPESASRRPTALLGRGGEGCSAASLGPGVPLRMKRLARSLPLLPETRAAEVRTPPRSTAPPPQKATFSLLGTRSPLCNNIGAGVFTITRSTHLRTPARLRS